MSNPSQFDPARFGVVHVWIGPAEEWDHDAREDIGLAVFAARAWGPDLIFVAHEADSDLAIRWADSGVIDPWAGRFTRGISRSLAEMDFARCAGRRQRRRAVLHEIGHFFDLGHLDDPHAVMFERLGSGTSDPTAYPTDGHMDETQMRAIPNDLATDYVTDADIAEFNRVRSA